MQVEDELGKIESAVSRFERRLQRRRSTAWTRRVDILRSGQIPWSFRKRAVFGTGMYDVSGWFNVWRSSVRRRETKELSSLDLVDMMENSGRAFIMVWEYLLVAME